MIDVTWEILRKDLGSREFSGLFEEMQKHFHSIHPLDFKQNFPPHYKQARLSAIKTIFNALRVSS